MTQSVRCFPCHILSASRAGAVCRIYNYVVGQGHDLVAKGIVQETRQVFLGECFVLSEIGSCYIADEQRVTGKESYVLCVLAAQQVADGFHRMSGCVQNDECFLAYANLFSVSSDMRFKRWTGIGVINDGCSRCASQVYVP